jgi:hypothetical protein
MEEGSNFLAKQKLSEVFSSYINGGSWRKDAASFSQTEASKILTGFETSIQQPPGSFAALQLCKLPLDT